MATCCKRRLESSSPSPSRNLGKRKSVCSQTSFNYALPNKARRRLCSCIKDVEKNRYIPEELLEEILLRLPAESLIMCKRVCKLWFNLINDPSFVKKHLIRVTNEHRKISSSYPRTFVLKCVRQELSLEYIFDPYRYPRFYADDISKHELSLVTICDVDDDGNSDNLPCVVQQVSLPPFPVTNNGVRFTNRLSAFHCNGIIHMFDPDEAEVAVLINPCLREFKLLRTPAPPYPPLSIECYSFVGNGFGYDPKANVYKYVKIFCLRFNTNPLALVYTMGTHSSWRMMKIDIEDDYCSLNPKGVYCKYSYYWWNYIGEMNQTILSFDFSEEKFRSVPIPVHLCQRMSRKERRLEVWKESVCFFVCLEFSWFSSTFEIWGMVEGSATWTKYLTVGPLVCINMPLAFWKDDELLMEANDGRIVSYNIYTQKVRNIHLPSAVHPGFSSANLCLNSLVSV